MFLTILFKLWNGTDTGCHVFLSPEASNKVLLFLAILFMYLKKYIYFLGLGRLDTNLFLLLTCMISYHCSDLVREIWVLLL